MRDIEGVWVKGKRLSWIEVMFRAFSYFELWFAMIRYCLVWIDELDSKSSKKMALLYCETKRMLGKILRLSKDLVLKDIRVKQLCNPCFV